MKKIFFAFFIANMLFFVQNNQLRAQTTAASDSICTAAGYYLSLAISPVSCIGASTGTATIASTGCVCMFSGCLYTWSNGQTTHTAANLPAGDYAVTVTHPNGCILDTTLAIAEPSPFVADLISTDVSCGGVTNGSATVIPSETAGTLNYAWSTGDTLATATNLAAGTYNVSVTNFINCQTVMSVDISEPPALSIGVATSPSCANTSNGSITTTALGGTPPYNYACAAMGSTQLIENTTQLAAGTYSLTVTDSNGCMNMANATVNALNAPQVMLTTSDATICIGQNTQLIAAVSGGGATFTWTPAIGLNNPSSNAPIATPTTTTTYTVTAHYANGCSSTNSVTIAVETCSGVGEADKNNPILYVLPNLVAQELQVQLPTGFENNNTVQVSLYNLMGQQLRSLSLADFNSNTFTIDMNGLPKGSYIISVAGNYNRPINVKVGYF